MISRTSVAFAHDYVTQREGAERVVATMSSAFPDAALYTSLYDPDGAFFEAPSAESIRDAVAPFADHPWESGTIEDRAERFGQARFVRRVHEFVDESRG